MVNLNRVSAFAFTFRLSPFAFYRLLLLINCSRLHLFYSRLTNFFILVIAAKQVTPWFKAINAIKNDFKNSYDGDRQKHPRQAPDHFAKDYAQKCDQCIELYL